MGGVVTVLKNYIVIRFKCYYKYMAEKVEIYIAMFNLLIIRLLKFCLSLIYPFFCVKTLFLSIAEHSFLFDEYDLIFQFKGG
jgi:hypothetical protein